MVTHIPTEPQTAAAALGRWRDGEKYMDDPDSGASDPFEVYWAAHRVCELAKAEGRSYEELGVSVEERQTLIAHILAHEETEAQEDAGWPEAEDPPEDEL